MGEVLTAPTVPIGQIAAEPIARLMRANIRQRVHDLAHYDMQPTLAILTDDTSTADNPSPTRRYIDRKIDQGEQLGIKVFRRNFVGFDDALEAIDEVNHDPSTHGSIVQVPLETLSAFSEIQAKEMLGHILGKIKPQKDVDALNSWLYHQPATALAVRSLIVANRPRYKDDVIVRRGRGRLVNAPLGPLMREAGALNVPYFDIDTVLKNPERVAALLDQADVLVTAIGKIASLTWDMFPEDTHPKLVIDAGTASDKGTIQGDVADDVRIEGTARGWQFTRKIGGVGPLTILHLLDNTVVATELESYDTHARPFPTNRFDLTALRNHFRSYPGDIVWGNEEV